MKIKAFSSPFGFAMDEGYPPRPLMCERLEVFLFHTPPHSHTMDRPECRGGAPPDSGGGERNLPGVCLFVDGVSECDIMCLCRGVLLS